MQAAIRNTAPCITTVNLNFSSIPVHHTFIGGIGERSDNIPCKACSSLGLTNPDVVLRVYNNQADLESSSALIYTNERKIDENNLFHHR